MSTAQQAYDVLDRLEASGDRCTVAYQPVAIQDR